MKTNITFKNTTIECTCNALTPILYREIFKKDFFEQLLSFTKVKSYDKIVENKDNPDAAKTIDPEDAAEIMRRSQVISEIAFIYSKQTEITDVERLMNLGKIDYYSWLSGFENGTFNDSSALSKIIELWQNNTTQTTESKNA